MKRNGKITLLALGLAIFVATAIAAVPGIFSTINATTGYLANGAGGTLGQAICSDGTFFDTPCNFLSGAYTTVDANGTPLTQRATLNFNDGTNTTVSCADNGGSSRTDCQINVAAMGTTVTQTAGLISSDGTSGSRQFYSTTNPMTTPPAAPDIFQNTTGFVLHVTVSADGGGGGFHGVVYCDSSSTPSTNVAEFGRVNDGSSNPNYYPVPVSFIVAPNYYYGISVTSGGGTPTGSNARDTWTEWAIH